MTHLAIVVNTSVQSMDVEQVKGLPEGTTERCEASGTKALQLRDKGSMILLPTSLEEGGGEEA